jgi:hypothetical protein
MPTLILLLALFLDGPLERLGRLDEPELKEASGIVASRRHPGIFWVHNDSGNPPTLFAVARDGRLVRKFTVAAPNIDWEDIAIDGDGHLYLGDIGNNTLALPVRTIYRLAEPDPHQPAAGPLKVERASHYRFPPGTAFDAEALVVEGEEALVIAKTHDRRDAEIFAIPLDPPTPLLRPALPKKVGTLAGFTEPVTGADLTPDGHLLAVGALDVARVYERTEKGSWKLLGAVRYQADGIEAIAWDGLDLILAGEGRGLYRIPERTWRAAPNP